MNKENILEICKPYILAKNNLLTTGLVPSNYLSSLEIMNDRKELPNGILL